VQACDGFRARLGFDGLSVADLPYQRQGLCTLDVPNRDRTDRWAEHVRFNQGELGYTFSGDRRDFIGRTQVQRCGPYQLVEFSSVKVAYHRTRQHVRMDDDRSARLVLPLEKPVMLGRNNDMAELTPGELGLVSMAEPMSLAHADGARALILNIPEAEIAPALIDHASVALAQCNGPLAAVIGMMKALATHRESLTGREFVAINTRLIELLAMSLDQRQAPHLNRLTALARDAEIFMAQRSDDPRVTVNSIADALGCSRRQLFNALKTLGTTPARLLRNTRLDRARRRLLDPSCVRSVNDIAFESGFDSISTFYDAFRKRYGVNPGQLRRNDARN
jgi:AraC-like DNA-binding protein